LYSYIGWPGSTHDNRSCRNCNLSLKHDVYFKHAEFLIGDSTYNPSKRMVSAYKRNAGEFCNTYLSSARFKSEHHIGLIKNRFPCLHGLNVRIKKPCDVKKVVHIFTACIILHNLLLSKPDSPEEWYEVCEEDMEMDVESDVLYGGDKCVSDEDRREQVKHTLIGLFNGAPL